jgi:hypothetical protein
MVFLEYKIIIYACVSIHPVKKERETEGFFTNGFFFFHLGSDKCKSAVKAACLVGHIPSGDCFATLQRSNHEGRT